MGNDDTEFNVGLVAVTVRRGAVEFTGTSVASGRGGAEQTGTLREALLESSDGLRMTVGYTVWADGSSDVQPLDFIAGPDAYRRLEAAGRMTLADSGAGARVALLRAFKYNDRGYPSLASVTWTDLDELAGTDVQELLRSHGAVAAGDYAELKADAKRYTEHPAFAVGDDGAEAVFTAFTITRILPIMKGFGLSGAVEVLHG